MLLYETSNPLNVILQWLPNIIHTNTSSLALVFSCRGKEITECCLSRHAGHFYIGTEGGDVYCMDVRLLELKSEAVISWGNATAL